jgi:hypothetical protein
MTLHNSSSTITAIPFPHCQQRTPSGRRCRMAVSDLDSGLCSKHAAEHQRDLDQADVAAVLIGDIQEFHSAADINHSLGELYKLQARNKITPRRAAVMAYTCNLLLRTLPAIARDNGLQPRRKSQPEPLILDYSDWPDRKPGSGPLDNLPPHPDCPGWEKGPAVARRALAARLERDKAEREKAQS